MGVEFRIGNRRVSSRQWAREVTKEVEKEAKAALEQHVRKRVRVVRCPRHGQAGRVVRRGSEIYIDGCCEELLAKIGR